MPKDAISDPPPGTVTDDRAPGVETPDDVASTLPSSRPARATAVTRGAIAGRYRLGRELGRGGMGQVFAAHDDRLGREVAVKLLLGGAQDEQRLRRFEQEARAAGGINHPNIVTVYDVVATDDGPCIVTELLEGETLRELLARGPLPAEEAVALGRQLAEGLVAAHAKGVVHRDLKPANLFVTGAGFLKILDFGIAKLLEPGGDGPQTESGALLGTVGYMSPEQVRGEPADERSDLFAAGVILHQMLAGAPPFQAPSRHQIEERILHAQPDALPASVPAELARIVGRCLEKDPARRFPSAAVLAGEITAASSRPAPPAVGDGARRVRGVKLALALAAIGVVAGLAVIGWKLLDRSAPQSQRTPGRMVLAVADFANETGEKDLGGLSGMLMTALEQSRRLSVLTQARMFDTLKQLGKGDVERIDESLGREVCRKARADALVHASIRRFGAIYSIDLKVLDPVKNEYLFAAKVEGRGKESVPGMLDRLSARMREGLHEKREEVIASSAPVAKSTTTNLEAYQHFFLGEQRMVRAVTRADFEAAADELRAAVRLDPGFALAHFRLWKTLQWVDFQEAAAAYAKTLKFADQLPERARCSLRANDPSDSVAQSIAIVHACAERFPEDRDAVMEAGDFEYHNGDAARAAALLDKVLAIAPDFEPAAQHQRRALQHLRRFDRLVELARAEVQRTHSEMAYLHLAHALLAAGDASGGNEALRETARRFPDSPGPELTRIGFHIAAGEPEAAEAEMAALAARSEGKGAHFAKSVRSARDALDTYRGRFKALLTRLEADAAGTGDRAIRASVKISMVHSQGRGDLLAARRANAEAARKGAPRGALFFARLRAGELDAADMEPDRSQTRRLLAAARSVAAGRPLEAAAIHQELALVDPDLAPGNLFRLAEAALEGNRPKTAIDALQKLHAIAAQDDWWGGFQDFPHLWQGRTFHLLGRAHEMAGEPAAALAAYERFLRIWSDADPDLGALADARARKAVLSVRR